MKEKITPGNPIANEENFKNERTENKNWGDENYPENNKRFRRADRSKSLS